jgi:branched-subunit amino acid permease
MTNDEIEVRVWAIITLSLTGILVISVLTILGGVLFVEHDMDRISPIDESFLAILKDIMLLCIGAIGGVVGRKSLSTALEKRNASSVDSTTAIRNQDS